MSSQVVTIEGTDYKLASIKAGQMRAISEERLREPNLPLINDNFKCVAFCLKNGDPNHGWTLAEVEDLDWGVYRQLLSAAQKLSGFDLQDPNAKGEPQAA